MELIFVRFWNAQPFSLQMADSGWSFDNFQELMAHLNLASKITYGESNQAYQFCSLKLSKIQPFPLKTADSGLNFDNFRKMMPDLNSESKIIYWGSN